MNALTITTETRPSGSGFPAVLLDVDSIRACEHRWLAQTAPGTLMAAAGRAVADVALRVWRQLPPDTPVILLVGPGNNGGDALVAGRHLIAAGLQVEAAAFPGIESAPPRADDACRAWQAWRADGHGFITLADLLARLQAPCPTQDAAGAMPAAASAPLLVIDGFFGIGLTRPLSDTLATLAAVLDARGATLISIDVPSGLDADTGAAVGNGAVFRADHTVTMIADKPGLHTGAGLRLAGQVRVAPLVSQNPSLPEAAALAPPHQQGAQRHAMPLLNAAWAARLLPHRPVDAHKGTAGDVLILGGRLGMAGAARLAARGAMAAGAGRTWIATEGGPPATTGDNTTRAPSLSAGVDSAGAAAAGGSGDPPEMPTHGDAPADVARNECSLSTGAAPAPDNIAPPVDPQHPEIMQFVWHAGARLPGQQPVLVVGCGMGQDDTARRWLTFALHSGLPAVIDADALTLLAAEHAPQHAQAGALEASKPVHTNTSTPPRILTPHPLEAARLLGIDVSAVQADRLAAARTLANHYGAVVVLKGAGTVIARPTGHAAAFGLPTTGDDASHTQASIPQPPFVPLHPSDTLTRPAPEGNDDPRAPGCSSGRKIPRTESDIPWTGPDIAINGSGHPVLGTAGTGDVLAGTIAALLAALCRRRNDGTADPGITHHPTGTPADLAWQAACLGVWLHGHAGELLARHQGPMGIRASAVCGQYPAIFRQLSASRLCESRLPG